MDFDEAARIWRMNKKYLGNGWFVYKCAHFSVSKNGYCPNKVKPGSDFCKFHCRLTPFFDRRKPSVPL